MIKKRYYLPVILGLVGVALFLIGMVVGQYYLPVPSSLLGTELRDTDLSKFKYINPLLACGDIESLTPGNVQSAEDEVRGYVNAEKSAGIVQDIGVYYRDLNNGPWFSVGASTEFSPGSLLKVPLLMTVLTASESDPTLLDKKVYYAGGSSSATQVIQTQHPVTTGENYSISELLLHMAQESDNNAALLLYDAVGYEKTAATYRDLGLDPPQEGKDYVINVQKYATFFRILYNATYLSAPLSEKALEILSESKWTDGLAAGLPSGTRIAHKFGEREFAGETNVAQLHDCGIIYAPQRPYILCVMTRGKKIDDLAPVIAKISSIVYSHVSSEK